MSNEAQRVREARCNHCLLTIAQEAKLFSSAKINTLSSMSCIVRALLSISKRDDYDDTEVKRSSSEESTGRRVSNFRRSFNYHITSCILITKYYLALKKE